VSGPGVRNSFAGELNLSKYTDIWKKLDSQGYHFPSTNRHPDRHLSNLLTIIPEMNELLEDLGHFAKRIGPADWDPSMCLLKPLSELNPGIRTALIEHGLMSVPQTARERRHPFKEAIWLSTGKCSSRLRFPF
jgi:hypothetical protein